MIGYIKGTVMDLEENQILLENNGIGYQILMPAAALEEGLRPGKECGLNCLTEPDWLSTLNQR